MVSVAIVGLLAAIAVPEFNEYRKRAYDVAALNDLKNLSIAAETYLVDHESFNNGDGNCRGAFHCVSVYEEYGFTAASPKTHLFLSVNNVTNLNYFIQSSASNAGSSTCSGTKISGTACKLFEYNSTLGKISSYYSEPEWSEPQG